MEESFPAWITKTLLLAVFGLVVSVVLRNTAFLNGVVGGLGHSLGQRLADQPRMPLKTTTPALPEKVGSFEIDRLYPVSGQQYRLESGRRYKIRVTDLQPWTVKVHNGSVSVWFEGATAIERCQSGLLGFQQHNGRYEIVSCSDVSQIEFSQLR